MSIGMGIMLVNLAFALGLIIAQQFEIYRLYDIIRTHDRMEEIVSRYEEE